MPRFSLTDRINAAKRFGLTKIEVVPGAQTRGVDSYNPGCYVGHHTAGPKTGDRPSLNVVVNGRPGLSGPLANDFGPRSGGLVIVACGRSNNAGLGGFRGIVGNSGTMACENEDDGDGLWTPEQWRDYPRIVASGLYLIHRDETWYCSHRTWALIPPSYPGRKIDPSGISDQWMQEWVRVLLINPKAVPRQGMPTSADLITNGEDEMAAWSDADSANLKKTADNAEKLYLGGVRAVNADGSSAPTALNYSLRGVNEALDIQNDKIDGLLEAINALPQAIADAITGTTPPVQV